MTKCHECGSTKNVDYRCNECGAKICSNCAATMVGCCYSDSIVPIKHRKVAKTK